MKNIKTYNEFIKDHVLIEFELFTLCDKSCSYCYNVVDTEGLRYNNDIENVLRGLEKIMSMNNKKIIIELIGGEPLLHKNFEQIIDYLYNNSHPDHKFSIITHADHESDFFKKRLGLLKKFGDKVKVTCTLHTENLNKNRFKDNIKWVDDNFKYSSLFFFTDNDYLKDWEYIEEIFDSTINMKLQPLVLDDSDLLETVNQLVNMNSKFEKYLNKFDVIYNIDGEIVPYNKGKYKMFKETKLLFNGDNCNVRAYEVDSKGFVTMCCFEKDQKPLGNIFLDPSRNLLNGKIIKCQQKRCQMNIISFEVDIVNNEN